MRTALKKGAVAVLTALLFFSAPASAQEPPVTQPLETRYLNLLRLLGAGQYEQAFAASKKLIDDSPQFSPAYDKLVEAATASKQLAQAQIYFENLVANSPATALAYYGLALVHLWRREAATAVGYARRCREAIPDFAPGYKVLVDAYWQLKQPEEAESYLKSITQSAAERAAAYYGLGYLYYRLRKWQEGLSALDSAIALHPASLEFKQMKALLYYYTNRYQEALEMNEALIVSAQAQRDLERHLEATLAVGILQSILGHPAQAATRLKEALATAAGHGNRVVQNTCLANLSGLYLQQDDYSQALSYGQQWLAMARAVNDRRSTGRALGTIGSIYRAWGDLAQAQTLYQESLDAARKVGDRENITSTLSDLGSVYIELKAYDQALTCFQEALAIARQYQNRALERDALAGQAYLHFVTGDYAAALAAHQQALQLARDIASPSREGASLNALGFLHLKTSDLQAARQSFQDGLAVGERIEAPSIVWQARVGLAAVCEKQGAIDQARENYQQAIEALERVRGRLGSEEERMSFFRDKIEVYEKLIGTLLELHSKDAASRHDVTAFHYAERARTRAFLELLAAARINVEQDLAPDLAQRRQQLENAISQLNTQLLQARAAEPVKQDQPRIEQLEKARAQADEDYANWQRELRRRDPRYAALKYPAPVTLAQTQQLLDEQTVLLAYSLSEPSSFLFTVSRDKYQATRLASAATIRAAVAQLLAAITDKNQPSPAAYRRQAVQLYQLLIEPAGRLLAGKRELIIVADDALHRLPFEVLLAPAASAQTPLPRLPYLVRDFRISYAPSASVLASLLSEPRRTAPKEFVAFADPVYAQGASQSEQAKLLATVTRGAGSGQLQFPPLPHSRREVEAIAQLFAPGQADLFLRAAASEENAKTKERLGQYGVVHFSAHGYVNEERPRFSGIVLSLPRAETTEQPAAAEDGLLSAYEIFNLKLKAELVVLSACETGLGKEIKGEGLMGLMRAFMYAGAPSVVVSLWKVDDQSAADLMINFYRHLKKPAPGMSKAEALRQAQLAAIRQGNFPYYWAPFVLIGKAR